MASKQTKDATVAIAKDSTTPTGGDNAIPLSAPSAGAVPVPTEACGSGTLSDLLKTGDRSKEEPPKLPLFSLSKEKRTSTNNDAAPEPKWVVRGLLQRAHLAQKATRDRPWANGPSVKPSTSAPL
jgi:hypothetical protein